MTDRDRVVCILTCADTAEELERLGAAFAALEQFAAAAPFPPLSAAAGAPDAPAYSGGRVCTPAHACAESGRGLRQRIVDRALPARR